MVAGWRLPRWLKPRDLYYENCKKYDFHFSKLQVAVAPAGH